MILRPCLHCRFVADCDIRRAKLAALKGSGITSASFRCDKRTEGLAPGTRVEVTIHNRDVDHYDPENGPYRGFEHWPRAVRGVLIAHRGISGKNARKALVWLDEPLEDSGRTKVFLWLTNIRPLDEPLAALCPDCSRRMDRENSEAFTCLTCDQEESRQADFQRNMDEEMMPGGFP